MTILIFIAVLVVLIVVHELGHFIAAKLSGMRVDEFGLGYPPKLWSVTKGETEYSINALPFGGFVKIYGEDDATVTGLHSARAFGARPRLLQAVVLIAGVAMNLLLAYVLITATLLMGTPRALSDAELHTAREVHLAVAAVMPDSPAEHSGLLVGDTIVEVSGNATAFSGTEAASFSTYISKDTSGSPLTFALLRNGTPVTVIATPVPGVIPSEPTRPALGVSVTPVGIVPVSLLATPLEGAQLTLEVTKQTAIGLATFFGSFFTLSADLSQVSGPVGIAGAVGGAAHSGLAALLTISAIISINLAIINLLPIPALDGGRLVFVIIEAIIRRPIALSVAQTINSIGFGALLLLMVVVTGHDIFKLFF